jgi:Na+/pantothenate symporter
MGFLSSMIIVVFMIPYMVGIVKGGAVSLQQLLGLPYFSSVLLVSGVACAYLITGGYMARCYTDVVQGIMMCIGMVLVVIAGFNAIGGPTAIAMKIGELDPQLLETPGPMGWTNLLLFSTVFAIAPWGLPQLVQTNFTVRNRKAIYTSAFVLTFWITMMLLGSMIIGNMGRAYFGNQFVENSDNLFPTMVLTFFPNVIGAVVICAVIAAAMSTIDGVLMTSGSALGVDIYKQYIKKDATDRQVLRVTNFSMLAIVVVVVIWAFYPPAMLLYFTSYAFSAVASGMLIPIFMGIFCKKGTSLAGLASQITGVAGTIFWYVVQPGGKYILGLPPFLAGIALSFVVFLIAANMSSQLPEEFVNGLFSGDDKEAYDA